MCVAEWPIRLPKGNRCECQERVPVSEQEPAEDCCLWPSSRLLLTKHGGISLLS